MSNSIALLILTGGLLLYERLLIVERTRDIDIEMIEPSESTVINPVEAEREQSND